MRRRPVISSLQNPLLARARAVLAGREKELLALEGERLIEDARAAGFEFERIFVAEEQAGRAAQFEGGGCPVERVAQSVLARVSNLQSSPGLLALVRKPRTRGLAELPRTKADALLLVVAGVADPGNLGALARSAEAAGAAALVVVAGGASPWNDKALRGSMGSLLRLCVFEPGAIPETLEACRAADFRSVVARTREGTTWKRFDWRGRIALWVTGETGSTPGELASAEGVTIPMGGRVESLNVAIAGSLLLFAAERDRAGAAS